MTASFSQKTLESIKSYVYCLVDPRDGKIFYIGEGTGNRVFDHARNALTAPVASDKIETIKAIINSDKDVKYYILRHGLNHYTAFEIESTLIDLLTFDSFNLEKVLTNIISGHHKWDRGIKTVAEIEAMYAAQPIEFDSNDKVVLINVNKTYKPDKNMYEIAKGDWQLGLKHVSQATHVLVHYRGIVRAVFRPTAWHRTKNTSNKVWFEGIELFDSAYLNKSIGHLKLSRFRSANYGNF